MKSDRQRPSALIAPFQPMPDNGFTRRNIGHRRYLVPVRNFEGPDELIPAHHVAPDGVVTDRRLIQWQPYPKKTSTY